MQFCLLHQSVIEVYLHNVLELRCKKINLAHTVQQSPRTANNLKQTSQGAPCHHCFTQNFKQYICNDYITSLFNNINS